MKNKFCNNKKGFFAIIWSILETCFGYTIEVIWLCVLIFVFDFFYFYFQDVDNECEACMIHFTWSLNLHFSSEMKSFIIQNVFILKTIESGQIMTEKSPVNPRDHCHTTTNQTRSSYLSV